MERYYTLNQFYRETFGREMQKAALDAGCSCPNREHGKGCCFCDRADHFTTQGTISQQLKRESQRIAGKSPNAGLIAYFQAGTNTYAPVDMLKSWYEEALSFPNVAGISIATRPDCISEEILELLTDLGKRTFLTVELGLQTVHDSTAERFGRGYPFTIFQDTFYRLREKKIRTTVHLINGLPGETEQDMLESARVLGKMKPNGVKLHLLHIIAGTPLAEEWKRGEITTLSRVAYTELVAGQITVFPKETVIERLTGDGAADTLLAPLWSKEKRSILNEIHTLLRKENLWQGCNYRNEDEIK